MGKFSVTFKLYTYAFDLLNDIFLDKLISFLNRFYKYGIHRIYDQA